MSSKPVFKKEYLAYERKENGGFWTIIPKYHPETNELIINQTSKDILDLCDGNKDIPALIESMVTKYPSASKELVTKDVDQLLSSYSRLNLIAWENGSNPYITKRDKLIDESYSIAVGTEEELESISKFILDSKVLSQTVDTHSIKNDMYYYKSPFADDNVYSVLSIRQKLFSYTEEFILLYKEDAICGVIGISMPIGPVSSAAIEFVYCPKAFAEQMFSYSHTILPHVCVRPIAKIKFLISNTCPNNIEADLAVMKYNQEATLQNEYGFESQIRIYSYHYDKKFIEEAYNRRRNFA